MFAQDHIAAVGNGMWRNKKGQQDLAETLAGVQVRAGSLDQGAGRTGGEKLLEPRHIMEVESTELGDGFEVGGGKRRVTMTLRLSD